jgi:leader peptidase (prepilin peptidase)/N-methyltransferase
VIAAILDIFLVAASPFVGSFLTAASRAWPDWNRVVAARSSCDGCGRTLGPLELVPVFSFLFQRGKCRSCGTGIWTLHPVGEAAAIMIAVTGVLATDGWITSLAVLLGWALLFAALVDLRTFLLPDVITLGLIPAGLAVSYGLGGLDELVWATLGAIAGYVILAGIGLLYRLLRGREGLGMGDAKLLAAGGAWCGLLALPWIVAIGAGLTLFGVAIASLFGTRLSRDLALPFGPGLAAGVFFGFLLARSPLAAG